MSPATDQEPVGTYAFTPHIRLRAVVEQDAEFILGLRLDPAKSRFLSPVSPELSRQVEWIRQYKTREAARTEYYLVIEAPDQSRLGTVRLYDLSATTFTWGSWILKPGSPSTAGIESALSVYELAFGILRFERSRFDVRIANRKVLAFHLRMGAVQIDADAENAYFEYDRLAYAAARPRYAKFLLDR